MATSEEIKTIARRKRTETTPRYQSADEALQAKHDQMAEYLSKDSKLDQLETLRAALKK
jgi:hypothetical protein